MTTKALGFTGRVGGVTYTDPGLFETAARALGFVRGGARKSSWKVGTPVRIRLNDGAEVDGQVWSRTDRDGWVWVALDNGSFVAVATRSGVARKRPPANHGTRKLEVDRAEIVGRLA